MTKTTMDMMTLGTFTAGDARHSLSLMVPPPGLTALAPGSLHEALERGRVDTVARDLAALGPGLGPVYAAQSDPPAERWRIAFRPARDLIAHWRRLRVDAEARYPSAPDNPYTPPSGTVDGDAGRDCVLETVQTPHNTLTIAQYADGCVRVEVAGMTYCVYDPERLMTGNVWDVMSVGALLGAGERGPESVLLLGLGGGTVTRQLRAFLPDARLVGVEFDPDVLNVAREKMGLSDQRVDCVFGDAYDYLRDSNELFDVVVDDLFVSGAQMALRVVTSVRSLKSRLKPGGVLVVNCADDRAHAAAVDALAPHFLHTKDVFPPDGVNVVLAASDAPLRSEVPTWVSTRLRHADDLRLLGEVEVE